MINIVMTTDIHGTPKFDSAYTDPDLAKKRYLYLVNVCLDTGVKLLETKAVTKEMANDTYIPKVTQILPVPHPRVN